MKTQREPGVISRQCPRRIVGVRHHMQLLSMALYVTHIVKDDFKVIRTHHEVVHSPFILSPQKPGCTLHIQQHIPARTAAVFFLDISSDMQIACHFFPHSPISSGFSNSLVRF